MMWPFHYLLNFYHPVSLFVLASLGRLWPKILNYTFLEGSCSPHTSQCLLQFIFHPQLSLSHEHTEPPTCLPDSAEQCCASTAPQAGLVCRLRCQPMGRRKPRGSLGQLDIAAVFVISLTKILVCNKYFLKIGSSHNLKGLRNLFV